jgi:hypothetical protein
MHPRVEQKGRGEANCSLIPRRTKHGIIKATAILNALGWIGMALKKQEIRFGKLAPLYDFVLNPYEDVRFSVCPSCSRKTKQRKLPLLIHIVPDQLMVLNKTCRYCPTCDLMIAHKDEIEAQLAAFFMRRAPEVIGNDYLVIGTLERRVWREASRRTMFPAELSESVHDFKEYREVQVTPGGWFPVDQATHTKERR